jgi:pimeloyl-ACP methyl ester carboxylesterase
MEPVEITIDLPDGRQLAARTVGPAEGIALVFHSGTPSAGLIPPFARLAIERGMRWISWSRPGYNGSTRQAGRSVADVAADLAFVLDTLTAEQCYVVGWSGGGPHALACAALLPDRVRAAASLAGPAPYQADGLDWTAGMGPENVEEFGAASAGPQLLTEFLQGQASQLAAVTGDDLVEAMGGLLSDVDRRALLGEGPPELSWSGDGPAPRPADLLAAEFRAAVSTGIWGWYDDDVAMVSDWGFNPAETRVPVAVWQGRHDQMVPFAHGQWLAQLPRVRAHLTDGDGHLSIVRSRFGEVLDDLMAATR